jgi:hypothetical protein
MKIIINENKLLGGVKSLIKNLGTQSAIDFVGGWETFCQMLNINSPMDFLHLFDDLEVVQSERKEHWTLFRYKKGHNLMIYDRQKKEVYISNDDIWLFLVVEFRLTNPVIRKVTKKWLGEVYNLREVTTSSTFASFLRTWMYSII